VAQRERARAACRQDPLLHLLLHPIVYASVETASRGGDEESHHGAADALYGAVGDSSDLLGVESTIDPVSTILCLDSDKVVLNNREPASSLSWQWCTSMLSVW
jgi:hypothetical protein